MADLEEELEAYVIRKSTLSNRLLKMKRNTAVPLLICDVIGAKTTNGDLFSVFCGKLEFKLCLLSGRIMGFISTNKQCNTYLLEDGTAYIELSVFKTCDQVKKANIKTTYHVVRFYHKPEFVGPLREMLRSAERVLDTANIIIGTALVVLGRIALFRGKIGIIGQKLFLHKGANRDMEVAFKDYLIECYNTEQGNS